MCVWGGGGGGGSGAVVEKQGRELVPKIFAQISDTRVIVLLSLNPHINVVCLLNDCSHCC